MVPRRREEEISYSSEAGKDFTISLWGFAWHLCFAIDSTAVNIVCPRQGALWAIWILILLDGLFLCDCTSGVILVHFIIAAILLSAIFLNVETSNYSFQIFMFFIMLHRLDIFLRSCNNAETLYILSLRKP